MSPRDGDVPDYLLAIFIFVMVAVLCTFLRCL